MPKFSTYPEATSLSNDDMTLVLQGGTIKRAKKIKFIDEGIVYKHPRGDAEYAGNTYYATSGSVYGVGYCQKILAPVTFKFIDVRMWGNASTAAEVKVYKAGSQTGVIGNLTLIQSFTIAAGMFNDDTNPILTLELTENLSLAKNEYLYVLANPTASTLYIKRWNVDAGEAPLREAFLYNTSADNWTGNWTVGAANYYGVPFVLRRAVGVDLPTMESAISTAKDEVIAVTQAILNPRITIPAVIHAVVGIEFNIYSDALILGTDCGVNSPKEYSVEYISTVGRSHERGFRLLAVTDDIGTKSLKINVYDSNHTLVATKTVSLVIAANAAPAAVKNVLIVGDSITNNGTIATIIQGHFATINSNIPLFYGTNGDAPAKHEGRSGWAYSDFVGVNSPFYSGGALNIAAYRTALGMGANKFDLVQFQLGVNESFGVVKSDTDRNVVIDNIKLLIDAFLADSATTKIIVQLPTTDGNTKGGWAENYGTTGYKSEYQMNVWRLRELIISNFDAGAYNANVSVGIVGLGLDRYYGYERSSVAVSARIVETEEVHTNAVHPSTAGLNQLGDSAYHTIRSIF